MAKIRALMFYEEQKHNRIKKIKSKTYRRIRKKQRLRDEERAQKDLLLNGGGDDDYERELKEKQEMNRVKERMSLAHKNTSKWAKKQLRRSKHIDRDTRRALSAQ